MLKALLLVGGGGAVGSMARYAVSYFMSRIATSTFPVGTLIVNLSGAFLIGLLFGWMGKNQMDEGSYLLFASGFCGGFTTFSTFALENISLMQKGQSATAILYTGVSLVAGLLLCRVGMWLSE